MESVFNVQLIIISTLMEFVVKLNPNVKTSTDKSEFVKPAIKDMVLSTESVLELT